jgi:hypothetical protein
MVDAQMNTFGDEISALLGYMQSQGYSSPEIIVADNPGDPKPCSAICVTIIRPDHSHFLDVRPFIDDFNDRSMIDAELAIIDSLQEDLFRHITFA